MSACVREWWSDFVWHKATHGHMAKRRHLETEPSVGVPRYAITASTPYIGIYGRERKEFQATFRMGRERRELPAKREMIWETMLSMGGKTRRVSEPFWHIGENEKEPATSSCVTEKLRNDRSYDDAIIPTDHVIVIACAQQQYAGLMMAVDYIQNEPGEWV